MGLTRSFGFKTVRSDGSLGEENAPQYKDSLTMSVAKALREDAFVSVTLPYLQNRKHGTYKRDFGDPTVAGRWTVISQDISSSWTPQLQLMAGHRFAVAKSQYESVQPSRLDAFGQGFSESKLGLDVFQGMTDFKIGVAHSFLFPGERTFSGVSQQPGFGQRSVVTTGYGLRNFGKFLIGVTREVRNQRRSAGEAVPGSEVFDNGFFLTCDFEASEAFMIRANWARRSAWGKNRNGSRSDSVSFASIWSVAP